MSRLRVVLLPALVLMVVAAPAGLAAARTTTVTVTATEFKFKLSTTKLKAGAVTFRVTNHGKISHDFKIAGKKTALVKPGKTASLKVTLKRGRYPYLCTVPGHSKLGMKGTVVVS